jgi:Zn-dependent protease with chaperone function
LHVTATDPAGRGVRGTWYDGRVSRPRPVLLFLENEGRGPRLLVQPLPSGTPALEFSGAQVGWPERWSARRAPQRLVIDLREQGSVQIDDAHANAWQEAAQAAGVGGSLAERMQTRWRVFIGVALAAGACLLAFYYWGTPWLATQLTRQVPLAWETAFAQQAMHDLDQGLLHPSKLPAARQDELRTRFDALARQVDAGLARYPGYAPPLALSFRSGLGPNAFALPGGTIVMTDALVDLAAKQGIGDDALAGVLAHEMGHVVHRHTTRLVVEQAVLNVGLGLAIGDVSHVLSIGASALTGLAYRRGHEAEADCFAAALMRKSQLPTAPMAQLLLALAASESTQAPPREGERRGAASQGGSVIGDLLSSHPDTAERARKLKAGQPQACS